jgi:hypothetical protein
METKDMDSLQRELRELEAKMDEAAMKNRELKEKIKACADEDSSEALALGLAEFNLFNYMDMLDDKISMLRSQMEERG